MPLLKTKEYTIDYIYSFPERQRAELIDGTVYNEEVPTMDHQRIFETWQEG